MRDLCEIHTLTSGPDAHCHAYPTCRAWSADGKSVFVESHGRTDLRRLLAIDIETGEARQLVEDHVESGPFGGFQFDYSPDADCIAYTDPTAHAIHLLDLRTMRSAEVWREPEGTIGGPLSVSSDGTRIAFWAMLPSIGNRWFNSCITAIFALDVAPRECRLVRPAWIVEAYPRRKLTDATVHVNHPQINPTNKDHICYSHEMHGAAPDGSVAMHRLWQVMADGSANRPLVRQKAGLHFTHEVIAPDGKGLIFPYMHGVARVDFDTRQARSIYYNPDCCPAHLTISPDQQWIAGDTWGDWRNDRGERMQSIMMFNLGSRKFAHLCWMPRSQGHPTHPHPIFSPDGTRIVFTHLVEGRGEVGFIDVSEVMADWDAVAQGVGEPASPDW